MKVSNLKIQMPKANVDVDRALAYSHNPLLIELSAFFTSNPRTNLNPSNRAANQSELFSVV